MTISYISRRTLMLGIAVLMVLSLLLALAFAVLHGVPSFGISHVVSHGRGLAGGGFPAPPTCPPDCASCPTNPSPC